MSDTHSKNLPPWTRVQILDMALSGKNTRSLEAEFGVHRATINRWVAKWGKARQELVDLSQVAQAVAGVQS